MSEPSANVTSGLSDFAALTPDRLALIHGRRRVTFAQLDEAVWQAAAHLAKHGVSRGDALPVLLIDPIGVAVAVLGAMRMGATPMLLSPGLTETQRGDLISRVGSRALLTNDTTAAQPGVQTIPFRLSELPREVDRQILDGLPDHPAIIMVGSGSTGEPWLIPVSHATIRARTTSDVTGFRLRPGKRFMLCVPMYFASAVSWLLTTVPHGVAFVLLDPSSGFRAAIDAADPDYLHLTVLHAQRLLKEVRHHPDFDLSGLTQVSIGASPVSEPLRSALRTRLGARLVVNYGTNETGTLTVARGDDLDKVPNTVGRPRPPLEFEIVDRRDRPVKSGDVGLIRARGPGIIDIYAGGAAPERFRDGWFYPGDLGRWQDGQLVHCGRADHMMIMDGINIYPAEIERCLEGNPAVQEAAAFPLPHDVHGQIPVCAVTLKTGYDAEPQDLADFVLRELGQRRPRRIVILDDLPRNPQGKLIRAELSKSLLEAADKERSE